MFNSISIRNNSFPKKRAGSQPQKNKNLKIKVKNQDIWKKNLQVY